MTSQVMTGRRMKSSGLMPRMSTRAPGTILSGPPITTRHRRAPQDHGVAVVDPGVTGRDRLGRVRADDRMQPCARSG
jgi:hypothetical protein